jgi:TPR repeat protein
MKMTMIDSAFSRNVLAAWAMALGGMAHSALPDAVQQEVQQRLACYSTADQGACEIALGDSGTPFGRVHRGHALMLSSKVDAAVRARAMEDFRFAAAQGYPPAYEALAIHLERGPDRSESLRWRWLAAEHGIADAAKQLGGRIGLDGLDRKSVADRMFLSWVSCHPASFDTAGYMTVALYKAREASPSADFSQIAARRHAVLLREAEPKAENFLHGCVPGTYYLGSLPTGEQAEVRREVRARMVQTLKNIREAAQKFPDLQLLTLPEYQDLLPPP